MRKIKSYPNIIVCSNNGPNNEQDRSLLQFKHKSISLPNLKNLSGMTLKLDIKKIKITRRSKDYLVDILNYVLDHQIKYFHTITICDDITFTNNMDTYSEILLVLVISLGIVKSINKNLLYTCYYSFFAVMYLFHMFMFNIS